MRLGNIMRHVMLEVYLLKIFDLDMTVVGQCVAKIKFNVD